MTLLGCYRREMLEEMIVWGVLNSTGGVTLKLQRDIDVEIGIYLVCGSHV